jgi:hypothetical protein
VLIGKGYYDAYHGRQTTILGAQKLVGASLLSTWDDSVTTLSRGSLKASI